MTKKGGLGRRPEGLLYQRLPISVCTTCLRLQRAQPFRPCNVHWLHPQSMSLRIFHDGGWRIESHGLIVEQRSRESCEVMALEIGAGVGDKGEAGGMRLGKSVERK